MVRRKELRSIIGVSVLVRISEGLVKSYSSETSDKEPLCKQTYSAFVKTEGGQKQWHLSTSQNPMHCLSALT
jgi:hypothetical protein